MSVSKRVFASPSCGRPSQNLILLACGSFNPPTLMHLRMFEIARDYYHHHTHYNVIGGIMSPVNDLYGKKGLQPAQQRIQMCRLATSSSDWITVDSWEAQQTEWQRTARVLHHIYDSANQKRLVKIMGRVGGEGKVGKKERLNGRLHADDQREGIKERRDREMDAGWNVDYEKDTVHVKLLCGGDLLESFGTPNVWAPADLEVISGLYGICCIKREGSDPEQFIYQSDMLTMYKSNIEIIPNFIPNDISSTKVRRSISRGESVKYLIPDEVIEHISENKLYTDS